jgi:hypothetical protein
MSDRSSRLYRVSAVAIAAALAQHVTLAAQSGGSSAFAVVNAHRDDSSAADSLPGAQDGATVPFAGTYQLTMALGADTADLVLRIGQRGEEQNIAVPALPKHRTTQPAPVRVLIVPASLSTDSSAMPAGEADSSAALNGMIMASAADTMSPGRWWVTVLAGDDTTSDTPAARLSRLLRRTQAERSALAERCRTDARRENRAADRRDDPVPCDEATGLPLSRSSVWSDGVLVVLPDGGAHVEQRTQTEAGELTLWGSRVPR